jgi:hypothetical protein
MVFANARVRKASLSRIVAKALNWKKSVKEGKAFLFNVQEQMHV